MTVAIVDYGAGTNESVRNAQIKSGAEPVMARTPAAVLAAALSTVPALAGGALDTVDITGHTPSPIAGQFNAKVIGIHWDPRCIPVQFRVNNTLSPIPNALGAPFLSVAQSHGLASAIMDARAPQCVDAVRAGDFLLGRDEWGSRWIAKYRAEKAAAAYE